MFWEYLQYKIIVNQIDKPKQNLYKAIKYNIALPVILSAGCCFQFSPVVLISCLTCYTYLFLYSYNQTGKEQ